MHLSGNAPVNGPPVDLPYVPNGELNLFPCTRLYSVVAYARDRFLGII